MKPSRSTKLRAEHEDWFSSELQGRGAGSLENGCEKAAGQM